MSVFTKSILIVVTLSFIAVIASVLYSTPGVVYRIKTEKIFKGEIAKTIFASGTLNPRSIVEIGSQVSGRIVKLNADFNDQVEEGQILAELDPLVLNANLQDSKAKLSRAIAQADLQNKIMKRNTELFDKKYISASEYDQYVAAVKSAIQDVESARSQVSRDELYLGYATIRSPFSGKVLSREVNVGQTLVVNLQTPVLFKIVEDPQKMQINANIAEADIDGLISGLPVKFTVDAYPDEQFEGKATQLRINSKTVSNVVTYSLIIDVDNQSERLLPGMTAYVQIKLSGKDNVLQVDNSVFRFKPDVAWLTSVGLSNIDTSATVLVKRTDTIIPVIVKRGLITATKTEVISNELREGDEVISDVILDKNGFKFIPPRGGGGPPPGI